MPKVFQYHLEKDDETTNRLEMTIHKYPTCDDDKGILIYSKIMNKTFPCEDETSKYILIEMINVEIDNIGDFDD